MIVYIHFKLLLVIVLCSCFPETQIWGSTSAQRVTPTSYIEDSNRFIKFTCHEYLYNIYQFLGWFQIKGSEKILLNKSQYGSDYGIAEWATVVLYKTLEPSDNETEIFCAKENILNGDFKTERESQKIMIKFKKKITPLESYVTIEPKPDDVIIYDENDKLHFTCSGSTPVDYRQYTWYLEDPKTDLFMISQYQEYNTLTNTNILTLALNKDHHQNQLYCAQNYLLHVQPKTRTSLIRVWRYGVLAMSNMVKLVYRGEGDITAKPLVTPEKFFDNNNTHIQFTCYAFLQKRELLSWYQIKGSDTILLKTIQLQKSTYDKGQWILLKLKKTLMYSDNGTNFYCAKESFKLHGNFSKGPESERIPIMFERQILALETPIIAVDPNDTTVYFDVNSTLYFNCSGSKPLDGRNYTWFINDTDSTLIVPMDQTYDTSTNQNTLTLTMLESYHEKTLFCAQSYLLYIQHSSGSSMKMYGELVRSNMITLVQWERVKTQLVLTTAPPLAFVVLLLITIVVVVVLKRRRRRPEPSREDKEEDVYTYAYAGRVIYAALDLPRASAADATTMARAEPDNYVHIVGMIHHKSDKCL